MPIIRELMDLLTRASLYPAISKRDLLKLPIPRIPDKTAAQIVSQVRQPHTARHEARALPALAQRAVKMAIAEREAKGLVVLNA